MKKVFLVLAILPSPEGAQKLRLLFLFLTGVGGGLDPKQGAAAFAQLAEQAFKVSNAIASVLPVLQSFLTVRPAISKNETWKAETTGGKTRNEDINQLIVGAKFSLC